MTQRIKDKAEKYDILDCIEMKEVCPNCEKELEEWYRTHDVDWDKWC